MANLAYTAVTATKRYDLGDRTGKKQRACVEGSVVLSSMGSATNKVLASAFGLSTIDGVQLFSISDDSKVYPVGPSYDGTFILVGGGSSNAPQDVSGTFLFRITGSY